MMKVVVRNIIGELRADYAPVTYSAAGLITEQTPVDIIAFSLAVHTTWDLRDATPCCSGCTWQLASCSRVRVVYMSRAGKEQMLSVGDATRWPWSAIRSTPWRWPRSSDQRSSVITGRSGSLAARRHFVSALMTGRPTDICRSHYGRWDENAIVVCAWRDSCVMRRHIMTSTIHQYIPPVTNHNKLSRHTAPWFVSHSRP